VHEIPFRSTRLEGAFFWGEGLYKARVGEGPRPHPAGPAHPALLVGRAAHSAGPQQLAAPSRWRRYKILVRVRKARGGAFNALNCELARFAKCSEQLREAPTYFLFSEVDPPLQKKWCSSPYT
jgi:hypothetical protein